MKPEDLQDAIGSIDDKVINAVDKTRRPKKKKTILPFIATVACICLAIVTILKIASSLKKTK
ncbi:hypothetical protein P261_01412 [Lachnospiraceae bacterium TWA4]|nr:hypothetical protein P261_01412 [Lachnospiraceae bacterium TWA4]